jgi:hypothetical protein
MSTAFGPNARRLGVLSALASVGTSAVYLVILVIGIASLKSPTDPVGDPGLRSSRSSSFLLMPILVALTVAIHAWAADEDRVFSLLAITFMVMLAALTCSNHFVILTIGHQPEFQALEWMPLLISFKWPSIVYALDILAWDVFFALSVIAASVVFHGSRIAAWIRGLLLLSGVLALAGLSGLLFNNMQVRFIGIAGYVGVFPVAALLIGVLFYRTAGSAPSMDWRA